MPRLYMDCIRGDPVQHEAAIIDVSHLNRMEENERNGEEYDSPPHQLFERLSYLSGYTWDQSIEPFHSVSLSVGSPWNQDAA